ncbi:amino acid adenylation domain-containing protein [Cupriavidus sp. RAF20_2]|jgi:amino acid adenylation domain-containing protein/thioester reductase-like protein|uniref:amino acid adenylation domain-containing protein n=1 Tax=Cupriavidus sp. RAF20_2 TaxID=3233053 RepID=UPI003F8D9544
MDASAEVSGLDAWFRRRVRQRPDAIALVYGGRHVSYAALDARVDSVARTLASRGVRAETPVGILLPAGIDQTICQLAVIRAGGSCLPLDPDAPDARIRLMLDDLDVRIAVSTAGDRARLGAVADCLADCPADCPADYLTPGAEAAGSIAMPAAGLAHRTHVLYTSGTTGQPKGVEILARGIVRLAWQPRYVSLNADDRIAAIANPTFDAALFETWGALLNGGTVVFLPRQTCIDPATFRHSLRAQGVTTMFITSALFNHTVHACPDAFATLRTLLVGGEALNAQAICAVLRSAPPARLLNAYGPTECTTFATCHAITLHDAETGAIPIGQAIDDTVVHVLDGDRQPVSPGQIGEIHLGGAGLARGYWQRPALTRERFVEVDHLAEGRPLRLYRTGDLGAWRPDGTLAFHGRRDNQVKIRGHRIELEEVEAVLRESGMVREAVATVQQTALGDPYLLAFIVPQLGEAGTAALAAYVSRRMPKDMRPRLVGVNDLPMTANGKVDRRALRDRLHDPLHDPLHDSHPQAMAVRGTTEAMLRDAWRCALDLDSVADDDDFFALGGDSLQAASLILLLGERLGRPLPVQALYDAPTPAKLATWLQRHGQGGGDEAQAGSGAAERARLLADARLPDDIGPVSGPVSGPVFGPPAPWCGAGGGRVFLTGATGFLGAFLLRDLLRWPGVSEVICLVRAPSDDEAGRRLRANLCKYGLWHEGFTTLLRPLAGDFALGDFGLGAARFEAWANRCDVVFHLGAHVNYIEPYSLHRAANVAGTLHVLRFVASGRAKALHYVSSIAAFGPAGLLAPTKTLYEDDDLARHLPGLMFDMGYAASQWVADQLVTAAIRRGVPAAVYRPGFILGDSASGAGNRNDFVARLVRGCIAIGAYPHLPHQRKEIVPVDYVSAALLRIAADGSNLGRAYHLVPPREADQPDLLAFFGMLRACGYPLQSLPYADWLQRLADSADLAGNPLRPLLPLLTEPVYGRLTRWEVYEGMPRYDATHTARALAVAGGLAFPRLDRALMARYLDVWMGQRPVPDTR